MATDCTPKCPWCGTAKHVAASGTTLRSYYCGKCRREFEDGPDDGEVGYGNPERYAQRKEEYAFRQHQRQQRARR